MKIPDWYLIEFVYSVCYDHFYSTEDNNTTIADECAMKLRKTRKKKCVMRNPGCFETLPSYKRIYDVLDTFPANAFEEFEKIFRKEWHIVMHDCMGKKRTVFVLHTLQENEGNEPWAVFNWY